ncbi:hypothetical protein MHU86_15737 [Fragilaria crotonensis]|nr:hypothetical protein MHU86_15737 [Fragilaria crotonensis]
MISYHQHQTLHPTQAQQNSSLKTPYQHIKDLDHQVLTTGYLTVVPHVIIHPFSATFDVEACHIPVSLADGTTKISTFKGTTDCYFTSDEGQKSILGLTDVYYIEGLSHRLLSLTTISATQNFTVIIQNRATTIQFPNNSKYTWPLLLHELPTQNAFSTMAQPVDTTPDETSFSPAFDQHVDPTQADTSRPTTSLPLETISRRLAHRNFRNLMTGSLHHAWNDHTLSPAIDKNTWPIRISISQKHARSKIPLRQGSEPFHQLHLDLMRNPFRFGLTTATNYSAYLFIVTTPGKLTGWIGLPTKAPHPSSQPLSPGLLRQNYLAAQSPSASSVLMPDLPLHLQNSSQNAPTLELNLKLLLQNTKK